MLNIKFVGDVVWLRVIRLTGDGDAEERKTLLQLFKSVGAEMRRVGATDALVVGI